MLAEAVALLGSTAGRDPAREGVGWRRAEKEVTQWGWEVQAPNQIIKVPVLLVLVPVLLVGVTPCWDELLGIPCLCLFGVWRAAHIKHICRRDPSYKNESSSSKTLRIRRL